MAMNHGPGYSALSGGRYSAAGEQYFLTFNLERPQCALCEHGLRSTIDQEMETLSEQGLWNLRTGVIMPDHVHLLVQLGAHAPLSDTVRLLKGRLAPALRQHRLSWQRSFFDHRLRHGEDALPVFRYIFINPYRAGLIPVGTVWRGYHCAPEDWAWFNPLTNDSTPFPEWLNGR